MGSATCVSSKRVRITYVDSAGVEAIEPVGDVGRRGDGCGAGDLIRRLETLQQLYPELSLAQNQALAASRERFLVVQPGHLAKLGLRPGDLVGVPGGETRATRAALARAAARDARPLVAIVRGGQRYIISM